VRDGLGVPPPSGERGYGGRPITARFVLQFQIPFVHFVQIVPYLKTYEMEDTEGNLSIALIIAFPWRQVFLFNHHIS